MFRTEIKLCGLSTEQDMVTAVRAGAKYAGLIFFPKSPRNVTLQQARELAERSGERIQRVGVLVDPDDQQISDAIAAGRLSALQFHGKETPERLARAKDQFGLPIWKAISVATDDDIRSSRAFGEIADLLLFDAKTPDNAALPGGMGLRFDWELLRGFDGSSAWGLSGGLNSENVEQALARTLAQLVDVSSGIEAAPGVKDMDKMTAFCEAVRHHDNSRNAS